MKKTICFLLTAVLLLAASLPAAAFAEDNIRWEIKDGVLIISGEGEMPVYEWHKTPWYEDQDQVTSIVIEEGVTSITEEAFREISVDSISLPASLSALYGDAFGALDIGGFTVSPDNPVYTAEDGVLYTKDKTTLVKCSTRRTEPLEVPATVTRIGDYAFKSCCPLEGITLPEGLTSIGYEAFSMCYALPSITIPASVMEIGPVSEEHGAGVFYAARVREIRVAKGNSAYRSEGGVLFTGDMKKIVAYPAGKMETSYRIPDGVEVISDGAFMFTNLEKVYIPQSVQRIEWQSFCYNDSLKEIHYSGTQERWKEINDPDLEYIPYSELLTAKIVFHWIEIAGDETVRPGSETRYSIVGAEADDYTWSVSGTGAEMDPGGLLTVGPDAPGGEKLKITAENKADGSILEKEVAVSMILSSYPQAQFNLGKFSLSLPVEGDWTFDPERTGFRKDTGIFAAVVNTSNPNCEGCITAGVYEANGKYEVIENAEKLYEDLGLVDTDTVRYDEVKTVSVEIDGHPARIWTADVYGIPGIPEILTGRIGLLWYARGNRALRILFTYEIPEETAFDLYNNRKSDCPEILPEDMILLANTVQYAQK